MRLEKENALIQLGLSYRQKQIELETKIADLRARQWWQWWQWWRRMPPLPKLIDNKKLEGAWQGSYGGENQIQ